jgi:hypothetical protein
LQGGNAGDFLEVIFMSITVRRCKTAFVWQLLLTFAFVYSFATSSALAQLEYSTFEYNNSLYRRKLLEYVSPNYTGSMLHEAMVNGLSTSTYGSSDEIKKNKEQLAKLYTSSLNIEHQNRRLESAAMIQWARQRGMDSSALRQTQNATEKAMSLAAKDELRRSTLESEKTRYAVQKELQEERLQQKFEMIRSRLPDAASSKSGSHLNALLESMLPDLLRFGYTIDLDKDYAEALDGLVIDKADFEKIQLKLNTEGEPITFAASEGSGSLGKVPFCMREPEIAAILNDFEKKLADIASTSANDPQFPAKVKALPAVLDQLEDASERVIGTKQQLARREGVHGVNKWNAANDFRLSLRGISKRLELEGSAEILQSRAKYDPDKHGNKLLPFLTFMASNGCRFAPAIGGGESSYVRMHELLLKLAAITED